MNGEPSLSAFDYHQRTRLIFGAGSLGQLASVCQELSGTHVLLVTDSGLRRAGHWDPAQGAPPPAAGWNTMNPRTGSGG